MTQSQQKCATHTDRPGASGQAFGASSHVQPSARQETLNGNVPAALRAIPAKPVAPPEPIGGKWPGAEEIVAADAAMDLARMLGVMDSNLHVLASEWLSPEGAHAVQSLQAVTAFLRGVGRDLRTTPVKLKSRAPHRPVRLAAWWPGMLMLLRAVHGEQLVVRADIPLDLPCVCIKPHLLTKVIFKLVSDASNGAPNRTSDHSEQGAPDDGPGPGKIEIAARPHADGRAVSLSVADNGAGMSPAALARAFGPSRLDRRGRAGPRPGLAMVHRMVSDAGGRVRLTSAVGTGTTVTIELQTRAATATGDDVGSAA